jgi:hypothetical protein
VSRIARTARIVLAIAMAAWLGCTVHTAPSAPAPPPAPELSDADGVAAEEPVPETDDQALDEGPLADDPAAEVPAESLEPPDDQPAAGGVAVRMPRGLSPAPPASCSGSRDIRLVRRSITADMTAVEVSGSCEVLIERSHIRADGVAIMISGSGDVIVRDSVIQGGLAAVLISGSGELRAERSRFIGRREISGTGELIDGGGNRWR